MQTFDQPRVRARAAPGFTRHTTRAGEVLDRLGPDYPGRDCLGRISLATTTRIVTHHVFPFGSETMVLRTRTDDGKSRSTERN
jgi:hypothetical protein